MKLNESQLRNIIKESLNYLLNNEPLNESYEQNVDNGLYNGALMNLDDVRKSLPKNTPKDIWNLYQQLFDAIERENENSNIPFGNLTVYIQKINPEYSDLIKRFEGKTFKIHDVIKIGQCEQEQLGVENCEYLGDVSDHGYVLPLPFSIEQINNKLPYSYNWLYAGYIRTGDESNLQENK